MSARLLLAAAVLGGVQLSLHWFGSGGMPAETILPAGEFSDLPIQLGSWVGEDVAGDPALLRKTGAAATMQRLYRAEDGQGILLYGALLTTIPEHSPPHPPKICYQAAGYHVLDEEDVTIPLEGQAGLKARSLRLERGQETKDVLYWYQLPTTTYTGYYEHRSVFWGYRGKEAKPALVKVMLETSSQGGRAAKHALKEFAKQVHTWLHKYQSS